MSSKHETIYPKGVYWAPDDKEKECEHCGKVWPESEVAWVEPNNMGFSGWDGGMWLCPDCLMDWKDGSLNL